MGTRERRQREKERRYLEIVEAAERIIFKNGLDKATMDDVADEAELSKGTLYFYFKSKEELYLAINARGLKILQGMLADASTPDINGMRQLEAIGRAYFDFCYRQPHYYHAMIYYESRDFDLSTTNQAVRRCEDLGNQTLKMVADIIRTGQADGSISKNLEPFRTAVVLWGHCTGAVQIYELKKRYLQEEHGLDRTAFIEESIANMVRSVKDK